MLVLGDFNGNLGDSLGDKGKYPPNQHGSKLLDFANYFNLCPANLLSNCDGLLKTYISDCGRHRSTLDYIFVPNFLLGNIISCKTFDTQMENTSDHLPIMLELNYPTSSLDIITDDFAFDLASNPKSDWSKVSQEEISEKYITPLVNQLENINILSTLILMILLKQLLIYCCRTQSHLQKRTAKQIKRIQVLLDCLRKLR